MEFKISIKKRGKKGDGRAVHFKPVQVPEDVFEDLKLYKSLYAMNIPPVGYENGDPIPATVSFGDMLRHWMDNMDAIDPDIQACYRSVKKIREKNSFATHYVDPAEGDIWKMRYVFEKSGEELPAHPDEDLLFCSEIGGKQVGMRELDQQGWTLMNEAGIEIDILDAVRVSRILLARKGK